MGSIYRYFLIQNAPNNDDSLRIFTAKLMRDIVNVKLNDTLKKVTCLFFTDEKRGVWNDIDENYKSDGPTVEDYNNPRRAEYIYHLDKENNVWLECVIYKNERAVIPSVVYIKSKKIKNE